MKSRLRTVLPGIGALLAAAAVWLPSVHLLFARPKSDTRGSEVSSASTALAARHLQLWTDPQLKQHELARMRRSNAEWDFMGEVSWSGRL